MQWNKRTVIPEPRVESKNKCHSPFAFQCKTAFADKCTKRFGVMKPNPKTLIWVIGCELLSKDFAATLCGCQCFFPVSSALTLWIQSQCYRVRFIANTKCITTQTIHLSADMNNDRVMGFFNVNNTCTCTIFKLAYVEMCWTDKNVSKWKWKNWRVSARLEWWFNRLIHFLLMNDPFQWNEKHLSVCLFLLTAIIFSILLFSFIHT